MLFEELLAYSAVISAATYATWRLIPGSLRVALAAHWATLARRAGLAEGTAEAIRRRAAGNGRQACGGCAGCGNRQTAESHVITIRQNPGGKHHAGLD